MDIESKNDDKVIIKIPLETGGIWQKEYDQNDIIENVIKDFKSENNIDLPQDYFIDLNYRNQSLKITDKIKSLLIHEIPTVYINQVIKKIPLKINNDDIIPDLIGKPFNEPFEVFLFSKNDKSLKIQIYDSRIINNLNLNNYSSSSAYCNGNNHLFISGGEKKSGEIIDNLWEIDLKNQNIAEPVKISPKKNHSMIFIPNNYVFIVGGNDNKTFYFNTENAEICEWANLNTIRTEPALQRISNSLYCFDNINKGNNDIFTIEKTDLNSDKPEWILITPKMNFPIKNGEKLRQKFFGISKDDENNIIFLGGNMDNYNKNNELFNYKYNTILDTVELSNVPYKSYNFKEKTFLSYNKNIDYILPDFNKQHPEVVFFAKNKNIIEAIDYELKSNSHVKSLKPQASDLKYDFNMPTVTMPDPIINYDYDQQNIQINVDQSNCINNNIKINDNCPSFQDNKFKHQKENKEIKNNYIGGIELQTNSKEPEIEPTKEDIKLSLDIQENLIENDEKINLRNKGNNSNIKINGNYQNNLKSHNNKISSQQGEKDVQKFHVNVNNHIKDINNQEYINEGKIEQNIEIQPNLKENKDYNNSLNGIITGVGVQLDGKKIEANNDNDYMHYDSKYFNIKNDFNLIGTIHGIKLKENKIEVNNNNNKNNYNFSLEGKIPGTMKAPNNNYNTNIDLIGPKINSSITNKKDNTENIKFNGPKINDNIIDNNLNNQNCKTLGNISLENTNNTQKLKTPLSNINCNLNKIPDFNINGNIPGKKMNTLKNSIPSKKLNVKEKEYNINGIIPGIKQNQKKISNKDLELSETNRNTNLNNNISDIGIKNQNIIIDSNLRGQRKINSKLKSKDICISGVIPGTKIQKNEILTGNIDIKQPEVNVPNLNITENKMNADAPKVDSIINNNNIVKEESNINIHNYDINGKIPGVHLNEPKININYNLNGNIPGSKLNKPIIEKKILNVDNNLDELKIETNNSNNKNISELTMNLPATDLNPPKIDIESNYNIKESKIKKEVSISKIEIPNMNNNITLKEMINPNYNEEGKIKEEKINSSNINMDNTNINKKENNLKDYNLSGIIVGTKVNQSNINNNKNNLQLQNSNINNNINNKSHNIDAKKQNTNINQSKINKPLNYNISGNIPGVKINNSNTESNNSSSYNFFLSGIIPSSLNNQRQSINYNKNSQNTSTSNNYNQTGIINTHSNNHGSKNELNYTGNQELKDSKKPIFYSQTNNNNDINSYELNAIDNKMQILNKENMSISIIHSIYNNNNSIQKSTIEYFPSQAEYTNKDIYNHYLNNNMNSQINNIKYQIDNNLKGNNECIDKNNDIDINIEMPKIDINNNSNNIMPDIQNQNNNILKNYKLTNLKFKVIEEGENKNSNIGEENMYTENKTGYNKVNSKRKNKDLPLVGMKNNDFKSSKIGAVGKLYKANIDTNNIKTTNVGVNGTKIGDRIIE